MSAEQKPFVEGGVIDGKAVAAAIREEIAATVRLLKEKHGKVTLSSSTAALSPTPQSLQPVAGSGPGREISVKTLSNP